MMSDSGMNNSFGLVVFSKLHKQVTKSKLTFGRAWQSLWLEMSQYTRVYYPMMQGFLKGIVHPKMKILSLITHPHVVPNPP